jgi:RNA polymerase sigma factor (sigma-70 family)
MLGSVADAEDAAQEILLRVITQLSTFRGESAFRTWVYRVAVRHLLAFRSRRAGRREQSFAHYEQVLDHSPDDDVPDEQALPADERLVVEEVKATCLSGLLLCLDRDHRAAFVLGEIFEVPDVTCAELLDISRDNVRKRISRAREQLRSFLDGRCGLVDPEGTCRCARKTRSFVQQGFVDPAKLQFTQGRIESVTRNAAEGARRLESLAVESYATLMREQPVGTMPDFAGSLRDWLNHSDFRQVLELDRN